ncbi:hypothetical protein [Bacteroides sp.]|uniref:hypothetical protein n=1 Tax=Bacteroides sp. TaxID=29523 RepID=UPI002606B912|nr:hypothetical protein [Bacteroides sp.]MDD3041074.1 hypothetical protein [Bacteroides sp.]
MKNIWKANINISWKAMSNIRQMECNLGEEIAFLKAYNRVYWEILRAALLFINIFRELLSRTA